MRGRDLSLIVISRTLLVSLGMISVSVVPTFPLCQYQWVCAVEAVVVLMLQGYLFGFGLPRLHAETRGALPQAYRKLTPTEG